MKYIFGVMSSKWSLEAPDMLTAYFTMILKVQQNVPIAVYEPSPYGIMPKSFMENNVLKPDFEAIRKCYMTIKEE
jgi:hypothetical protein